MAETVRIEIPIETIDETEPELSNVAKKIEDLGDKAEKIGQRAKKSSEYVSAFDRQAQKTEKTLSNWAKEKYEVLLEAKDRISPLLSTVGGGIKSFAGRAWNVTLKAVDLVTAPVRGIINLLKNPLFQVGAVLGVSIGLKDTIETYKDFEAAMSQVQAISGATGSEVAKLTEKAKEMGATTKFTAEESAEAFNYMAMAGWKTEDMLNGIEGILSLAAASGEDLATTSDIVTDALTAFNMKASDAGRFSDVLAAAASNANTTVSGMGETFKYAGSMAGALGYSIEDVALMTGLMANTGIKGTMAGTALNSIFTRLSTNTSGAADAIHELGIEFFTSEGKARDLSDVMGELRAATADMNPQLKSQLANTIAGTEAQKGLLSILNASEEDYRKLADAIDYADGSAARMSETMLDNLQGSITLLQSAVDGVKISFGERLSPYVRKLADWLTDQMPAVEQGLNEFMDWVDTRMDRMQRKFDEITDTREWQDADLFGKVKIAWDEFIAEPFSEWWNSTGKAKFAGFAQDIGTGIGTGLKAGIMTLLGIDLGETLDEGVSIGASFAKGFSEGFDFNAISEKLWGGFGNLVSDAGKLLPGGKEAGLSSLVSAAMLAKVAAPAIGIGKGAFSIGKSLFGKSEGGTSLAGSILGKATFNEGVDGSITAGGRGLLGLSAKAGHALGAGTASGAGTALVGGGAIAGGLTAGATLVSGGIDAYTALTSDNSDKVAAYGKSAAWKAGGVAAGAGIGAAVGSFVPVIGTAAGALIGAGIGGIAGWAQGNKTKENYEEQLARTQKEAEKAQKVLQATGRSLGDVKFETDALNTAINDTNVSAEQLGLMLQEAASAKAAEKFGDISLSLKEIKEISSQTVFGGQTEELDRFTDAASDAKGSFARLQGQVSALKKMNWKNGLQVGISGDDAESWKEASAGLSEAAKAYLEDKHYEATASVGLLVGKESGIASGIDSMYSRLQEQVDAISSQLSGSMEIALQDGIITLNEHQEIVNLQSQITAITDKVASAQEEAKFASLKIKYGGAGLDAESFARLQEELKAGVEELTAGYDDALQVSLTNLQLQLGEGAISQSQYDEMFQQIADGYNAQIDSLSERVGSFQLGAIADAFSSELDGILPGMAGTVSQKLQKAVKDALSANPDASLWTQEDMAGWFGLNSLSAETQTAVAGLIQAAAESIPAGAQEVLAEYKAAGTEWGSAVNDGITSSITSGSSLYRIAAEDAVASALASPISASADVIVTPNVRMAGTAGSYGNTAGSGASNSYSGNTGGASGSYPGNTGNGDATGYTGYTATGRGSAGNYGGAAKNAAGGYVSGGPQLSWLAEEGYGEFVIPTNPSRRGRALELYEQAGAALGVSAHADGGYAGRPVPGGMAGSYNLFNDANKNAPLAFNEATGDKYDGETVQAYEPSATGMSTDPGTPHVQVSVKLSPEYVIHVSDGQGEDGIMQVLRKHMKEMADELGGEIAVKLVDVYKNMPVKGAGYGY